MTVTAERHGTLAGYTTDRCRCDGCRDNWRSYQKAWKAQRVADLSAPHDRVRYVSGCRCETCRAANADYNLKRKARLYESEDTPHGTVDGYGSYGCRCNRCSAAKRAATRSHYLRNQIAFFDRAMKRRVLKSQDERQITVRDISRLIDRHRGGCAYCGSADHIELDHVVPLSRGGRHSIGNLLPACRRCNRSKHAHLLVEWTRRRVH